MRTSKRFTFFLLIPVLLLAGCSNQAGPEAAFEGFKTAMQKEDFEAAFAYLTPESQDVMLSMMVIPVGMMQAFNQIPPELEAVLKKHELDLNSEDEDPLSKVKNKGECFRDLMSAMNKQAGEDADSSPFSTDTFKDVKLTDLKIDGTTATGMAEGEPVHFAQIDGKWLIDMKASMDASMEAQGMPPGGMPPGGMPPGDFMFPSDGEGASPGSTPDPFGTESPGTESTQP